MAILMVNKDGTSSAKVGDYVVTGGGVYQKTATGSIRVMGLDTPTGSSKNMSDVVSTFNRLTGGSSGSQSSTPVTTKTPSYTQPSVSVDSIDDNGIAKVTVAGYDPTDYSVYSGGSSSSSGVNISSIMGYIVLGLVGIALLDRFMNGKER